MRSKSVTFAILLILLAAALPAATVATPAPPDPLDKVELLVLEEIDAAGRTDFFVVLAEKADLAPAEQLQTKLEKGRFVYETLVATAERTQGPLRAYLDAQGVDYQAFYIANKVLVYGGDQDLVLQLAGRDDVAAIAANRKVIPPMPPSKPQPAPEGAAAVEPNIAFVNADDVWALGYTGQGTVLAQNGAGVDETHPALARHYRGCVDPPACTIWDHNYNWWDATGTYPTDPHDGWGIGDHAAGLLAGDDGAGNQIGMAPGARTIHCKVVPDNDWGTYAIILECLQWNLAPWDLNRANPRPDLAPDVSDNPYSTGAATLLWQEEIGALQAAGIMVTGAASAENGSCSGIGGFAQYHQVLGAGLLNQTSPYPGTIYPSSGRGPSPLFPNDYVPSVMAPAVNIRSAWLNGTYLSYTFWDNASPHLAGLVGLLWSANPALRGQVALTRQIVQETAAPLTGQFGNNCGGDYVTGPNNDWGYGTIDALAAVSLGLSIGGNLAYLNGAVSDAATTQPIAAATVSVYDAHGFLWSGPTDAAGVYTVSLSPGTFTVTAGAFGYYDEAMTGVVVVTGTATVQDFDLTALPAYLISGMVTEARTGLPLSATVTVHDTPLAPAATDPATGFYSLTVPSGTYTLVARAAAGHVPAAQEIVADHDQSQDFVLSLPRCLLVVADVLIYWDITVPYYTSTLNLLGYSYDVWDVELFGHPNAVDLSSYGAVVWHTPVGQFNGYDEPIVAAYLDGGGNLFLSDMTYLARNPSAFGQDYLGITSATYNCGEYSAVAGNPGNPIGDGLGPYALSAPPGWGGFFLTSYVDGAQSPFRFVGSGQNNSTNYDGGAFKTVFLAWPLETLWNNPSGRAEIMDAVLDWFGLCCAPIEGADFAWWPPAPIVGQAVTFTGTVSAGNPPITYTWDFGDSSLVFGPSSVVTHTYTAAGPCTVVMTATNCAGATATVVHTLIVQPPPCVPVDGADFSWLPVTPTVDEAVTFTGTVAAGDTPITYTWDFGDSSLVFGPSSIVTHTYTAAGPYTVVMTATNCATATTTAVHTLTVLPPECEAVGILTVTADVTGCVATLDAELTGDEPFIYLWDLGPLGTYTATNPVVDFVVSGVYSGTLSVWNCGNPEPATSAFTVEVNCQEWYFVYLPIILKGYP